MTQAEAAQAADISLGWYRTIENGPSFMSCELAERLGKVLGVPPEDLLGDKYRGGSP